MLNSMVRAVGVELLVKYMRIEYAQVFISNKRTLDKAGALTIISVRDKRKEGPQMCIDTYYRFNVRF